MTKPVNGTIFLDFQDTEFPYSFDADLDQFFLPIDVNIYLKPNNGDANILIGYALGWRLRLDHPDALDNFVETFDVTQETFDIYDVLYEAGTQKLRSTTLLAYMGKKPKNAGVLMLEHIIIEQAYRGHGYGKIAIEQYIKHYGSCVGLAIIESSPVQLCLDQERPEYQQYGLSQFSMDERAAREKLTAYFSNLNFRYLPVLHGHYMIQVL